MSAHAPSADTIFVAGFGRSGTNWLLNLLDLHPATHCRNEPDAYATSPFRRLPSHERQVRAEEFAPLWDAAVQWASDHYGDRDRLPRRPKSYLRARSARLKAFRLLEKRRLRSWLGLATPALRNAEFGIPPWLDASDALERARHVLKLNDRHGWYAFLMAHRPGTRVVHLVRHPGGVLQSWRRRWLARHDPEQVRRGCIDRLRRIAEGDRHWAERFGDLEQASTEGAELWYWRYSTEHMCRSGAGRPGYKRVLYEQLVADPEGELREVYAHCGLSWDASIALALHAQAGAGEAAPWYERVPVDASAASGWRAGASREDLELIERVLEGSPLRQFWS